VGHPVRALSLLVLCAALGAGGQLAGAQTAQPAPSAAPARAGAAPAAGQRWGDGRASTDPRKRPAHGSPYNWTQMGLAAILMAIMLAFVVWLIRRETRGR
jgi:hypothetical protein